MDFHQKDIRQFLLEAIPDRFNHLSPGDFADFVSFLFEVDGFEIVARHPSQLPVPILIANKEDMIHAIFPIRVSHGLDVNADILEQVNQVAMLHEADQAWVISTSEIEPEIKKLAEQLGIELWDWETLYAALCQLFFEGQSHEEYFEKNLSQALPEEKPPILKLKVKWQAAEGIGPEWYNLGLTISNPTNENIYIHLQLPALIDHKRHQIMADQWVDGEFVSGLIYAGASIQTNALFSVAKAGDRPPGGKIMLTCHERTETPVTYHLQARIRGEACYLVTYCYTTQSKEYLEMTRYRDQVLATSMGGRMFIAVYYALSPFMVRLASAHVWADQVLRIATKRIVSLMLKNHLKSPS